MTQTLQQFCDQHPNGTPATPTLIDLGGQTFTVGADPSENPEYPWFFADSRHDLKIDNGTVIGSPTSLNHRPVCLNRGERITFGAGLTIHGNGPDDAHYSFSHEFGHGIESAGSTGMVTEKGMKIVNCWGSGVMVTKRTYDPAVHPERWTTGIVLQHDSAHHGRQHVAFDAVDGWLICGGVWQNCAHAAVDAEAPGSDWGIRNGRWTGTIVKDGFTFTFAHLGSGAAGNCRNNQIDHVTCQGTPFGVRIWAPPGERRSLYTVEDCGSDTEIHIPAVDAMYVDGLTVRRLAQPISGGAALVRARNCTGVDTDCPTAYF